MSAASMTRVDELQADDAIWGLDEHEQLELEQALLAANMVQDTSWEHSAVVATLALQQHVPTAPSPWLMEALRANAPLPKQTAAPIYGMGQLYRMGQPSTLLAAALLLLCVTLWWTSDAQGPRATAPAELRRELLQAGDTAVWNWSGGTAAGDVVWHAGSQRGAMRFRNLPANDPHQRQYQLWIVDAQRNAAHPVDGGVFDVPQGQSEVIIPIDPKVVVHEAQAFVVTVEVPGGVVVSDRKQIVGLAKPQ